MGGGCQVPIGAFAEVDEGGLRMRAVVARPDGSEVLRESQSGSNPISLGEAVGQALLKRGGSAILEAVYSSGITSK
jgi:hydroxymethylbilane synthase